MNKGFCCVLIGVVLTSFSAACSYGTVTQSKPGNPYPGPEVIAQGREVSIQFPVAPSDAPQPSSGKASISGALYSYTISRSLPRTIFYLTRAVGEGNKRMPSILIGPEEERGDIRGLTNEKSQFTLNNIAPGNYYLIVWAPYDWIPAVNSSDDPSLRLIELTAGQSKALGIVYVPWP